MWNNCKQGCCFTLSTTDFLRRRPAYCSGLWKRVQRGALVTPVNSKHLHYTVVGFNLNADLPYVPGLMSL
jgi:hypothetical protein